MKIAIPLSEGENTLFINNSYVDYLIIAGYTPYLVTPNMNIDEIIDDCDGLLLPGGIDIDPTYYGENNTCSKFVDREKDNFERELYNLFINANKKVFGICRGLQLIFREYLSKNETDMFSYMQHINGHSQTGNLELNRNQFLHSVLIDKTLYNEKQNKIIFVNSMHHQCVRITQDKFNKKENGITILGYTSKGLKSDSKGYVLEAFELNNGQVRAVQWHPEELDDIKLIQTFFGE